MSHQESNSGNDSIAGERRADRRYELELEVRWKLIRRRRLLETGRGCTINLSSGGVLFDAGRPLPAGLSVELSVVWPALLHEVSPLQLVVQGKVVRSFGNRVAIRMRQHEFRTAGALPEPSGTRSEESTGRGGLRGLMFPGKFFIC
jgi:hypothetical protein